MGLSPRRIKKELSCFSCPQSSVLIITTVGEQGDEDIARGVIDVEEEDDTDNEFLLVQRRHKYTQEQKLAAIDYFATT
jgi:hypothetical protein